MNQLGDAGFASITTALSKNTAIEDVGLGLSVVTKQGIRSLVKMWYVLSATQCKCTGFPLKD